jgi:hypothetical protein
MLRRHIDDGEPLAVVAAKVGLSLRSTYKWLARYGSGCVAALVDRRSVRRHQRRSLDPHQLQRVMVLCIERCTLRCSQLHYRLWAAPSRP